MRKIFMSFLIMFSATGCYVSVQDGQDDWDSWDEWDDSRSQEERASDVCDPYCLELIECGALSESAFVSCRDFCSDKFEDSEQSVTEGCACVQAAECSASLASRCEGDPLPGVFEDSTSGEFASSGGAAQFGGDYSVGMCETNHDCALGEDCIDASCARRCVASCQCGEGQACLDGYCEQPEEPVVDCSTDCDCTSGQQCLSGSCR